MSSGLEAFIRAKYEQKKYIAAEWVPPKPKVCIEPNAASFCTEAYQLACM